MSTIVVVALGGAIGATMRYGVNVGTVHYLGHGYPWGTMIVNILGSFLMGIMIGKFAQMNQVSPELKALLTTGFLGAFTTFSTFSLDFITLWNRDAMLQAFGYMMFSVILGILALALGLWIMRSMAS
ncbi:MAG: fluoride efflux transporter CrcB [Alphaproteobacteria bacterium]|nr:fluoride efflux transporter CrcB [Alphaproteobacteria bacterium]